ncbi:trypsin-like peptidase domain-containing protein [Mycobacterium kansasii]
MTGSELPRPEPSGQAQNPTLTIPHASFATLFLEMVYCPHGAAATKDDEPWTVVATGTGFFYRNEKGQDFILTARHNLTGKHWETGEFLSRSVSPTHVRFLLRSGKLVNGGIPIPFEMKSPGVATTQMLFKQYQLPLVDDDENPTWLDHPDYGSRMDVAAIPFENPTPKDIDIIALEAGNEPADTDANIPVTQEISIPGYPFGLHSGPALPLWIRGFVASEPRFFHEHNGDTIPAFLVDARTRKGSSGSPAVLLRLPGSLILNAGGPLQYSLGAKSRLLGVYTGRISDESDLGFVWHIREVATMCRTTSAEPAVATDITTWGKPPTLGQAKTGTRRCGPASTRTYSVKEYAALLRGPGPDRTPESVEPYKVEWLQRRLRGAAEPALPGYKAGGKWRATQEDVDAAIELLRPRRRSQRGRSNMTGE